MIAGIDTIIKVSPIDFDITSHKKLYVIIDVHTDPKDWYGKHVGEIFEVYDDGGKLFYWFKRKDGIVVAIAKAHSTDVTKGVERNNKLNSIIPRL